LPDNPSRAVVTAETIGSALGSLARRVDALKKHRASLATDIHAILAAGHRMLSELGHPQSTRDGRKRQPKGSAAREATKARLRASWQQQRAQPHPHIKKRTMSEEARAKIAAAQKARWAKARQS
jgi:hypothetical protein